MKSFKSFVNENRGTSLNEGKEYSYESGDFYNVLTSTSGKSKFYIEWGYNEDDNSDAASIYLELQEKGKGFILKSGLTIHPGDLADGWVNDEAYETAKIEFKTLEEFKASTLIKTLVRFLQGDSTVMIKRKGFEFRMNAGSKVYGELNGHKLVWKDAGKMNKEIQTSLKSKEVKEMISYLESL